MSREPHIPAYPLAALVAKANGESRRSIITKLAGAGILERHGGRWCVGKSRLRERLTELYDGLYEHLRKEQETAARGRSRQETARR
jgi:hypothetical protein